MNNLRSIFNRYKKIVICVLVLCTVLLLYFFINGKQFTTCNDQRFQYDIFYSEWYNLIKEFFQGKGLPLYSWKMYLGTDFYSSMSYYCTGDIFIFILFPLFLLLGRIKYLLTIETFLCIFFSAFWSFKLLKELRIKKEFICISGALIYAFGGFVLTVYGEYMFHRFLAFLPMLFYGIEYYINTKKNYVVIISVFILFLQNYYLMWPTSLFLIIYCLARELSFHKNAKECFRDVGKLLLAYFIGLMLSSFILIPTAKYITGNSRVGDTGDGGVFWQIKTYIGLLLSPIVSSFPMFTEYNNIFQTVGNDHGYRFSFFIGIIFFVYSLKYCCKKENINYLISIILLFVMISIRPICSIMNGLSIPSLRWSFLIELYLIILGAKGLDEIETINNTIFIVYLCLCIIGIFVLILLGNNIEDYKIHYISIAICVLLAIIAWFIQNKNVKFAIILTIIQCFVYCFFVIYCKTKNDVINYERIDSNEVAYYDSQDSELVYRYFMPLDHITPYSSLNLNKAITYGFMSSKTYNSTYDNLTNTFNELNGQHTHYIDITNPYSLNMLGTKYWIVYSEEELPRELSFSYAHTLSDLQVYENLDYKGFGYTLNSMKYLENINGLEDFNSTLFIDDSSIDISDYHDLEYDKLNVLIMNNNFLSGEIVIASDNILLIPIPNNKGWNVKVNNESVETISVNGGFMGIPLKAGYNEISMSFISPGLKEGLLISFFGIVSFVITILIEERKAKKELLFK